MNNTFSLQQITQTGNLDSKLLTRQYKLDLMTRCMELKVMNPRLTQKEIVKELGYSICSLQCCRHDINMLSPYRIPPNSHKTKQTIFNRNPELERPQLNSNDLK